MGLTEKQLQVLANPLNRARVATRRGDGKQLSYLEAWDVKAHLIRVFGYGAFDTEVLEYHQIFEREYMSSGDNPRAMIEVAYSARVRLTVRDPDGNHVATYVEVAVGQANVGEANSMRGDAHDNAIKQAESDALKRCAINLGNQFGLSLYNDGSVADVVKGTIFDPPKEPTPEQQAGLEVSLGYTGGDAMITRRHYDTVRVGQFVRDSHWPTFHQVIHVDRVGGFVQIDVAVGGLVEKLKPGLEGDFIEVNLEGTST